MPPGCHGPGPASGRLRQFRIVDQGAVGRQGDRHCVSVVLAAGDDLVELPGDRIRHDDVMLRHQVAVILQGLDRGRRVDQDLPGGGIEVAAAVAAQEWREATQHRRTLPPPDAQAVAVRRLRGRQRRGQEVLPIARGRGKTGLGQQRLLVIQDAGGHAVRNAQQLALVAGQVPHRRQEVVPVEVGMAVRVRGQQPGVIRHMRRQPPREGRGPLDDVDVRRARIQLRLQPRAQRVDGQQGEIDLDAGFLLEGRRDLLHQAPVPGAIVADKDQFVGLALGSRDGGGGERAQGSGQKAAAMQLGHGNSGGRTPASQRAMAGACCATRPWTARAGPLC